MSVRAEIKISNEAIEEALTQGGYRNAPHESVRRQLLRDIGRLVQDNMAPWPSHEMAIMSGGSFYQKDGELWNHDDGVNQLDGGTAIADLQRWIDLQLYTLVESAAAKLGLIKRRKRFSIWRR